ncbi:hypothetical protein B4U80_13435 [Leptotrombidium deliense]|uniref:Uncharacterized protein n=1 Tax=Leptotrombidium deliense TaxID=299467 RepID=A0A443S6F0_9ACAR|nr:hypothetical protein B4U80_13435 [Leptotrombidium deliense]
MQNTGNANMTLTKVTSNQTVTDVISTSTTISPVILKEIEQRKTEFCAYKQTIDAAMMSTTDYNKVILFSGSHYFEMDLQTATLVNTKRIKDTWPELESDIDSACSITTRKPGGFLFTKGDVFWFYISATEPVLVNKSSIYEYLKSFGLNARSGKDISCLSCYCKNFNDCKISAAFIQEMDRSFTCNFDVYLNLEDCHQQKKMFHIPDDLTEDLIQDAGLCRALSFVVGVTTPSTVFFVDDVNMHFWRGNNTIYTKPVMELFGCATNVTVILIIIVVIILTLIFLIVIAMSIIVWFRSSKEIGNEPSTDAVILKRVPKSKSVLIDNMGRRISKLKI